MSRVRELPPVKRVRTDRIIYTFPLATLPEATRQSALVIVWHADGDIKTCFVPDITILKENGEVGE